MIFRYAQRFLHVFDQQNTEASNQWNSYTIINHPNYHPNYPFVTLYSCGPAIILWLNDGFIGCISLAKMG